MTRPERNPAVVIGAGPYGLSIAARLRAQRIPVQVFGDPMGTWREHMPAGMLLKSAPSASSLAAPRPGYTLDDFCDRHAVPRLAPNEPVPVELFVRYGRWFQEHLVPDVERARVTALRHTGAGSELTLDSGEELRSATVVVASGLVAFAHVPRVAAALVPDGPSVKGPVSHSSQHADLSALSGRRVAVLGAGQSALETAVLLHEAGAEVQVVARRPVVFAGPPLPGPERFSMSRPPSPLGDGWKLVAVSRLPGPIRYLPAATRLTMVRRVLGPSGAWWLRERFEGTAGVRYGRLTGATLSGDEVHLTVSGTDTPVVADHVIAATGYRVDLDRVGFLDPGLRDRIARTGGWPRLRPTFESSVPGLYFAGLTAAATFGPVQRFVCGTGFAAGRIGRAVAASGAGR
jgi:thioredoxin reductase